MKQIFRERLVALIAIGFLFIACTTQANTATIGGRDYLDLRSIGESFGMKAFWIEKGKSIRLKSEWTEMDFHVNRREFTINNLLIHLGDPIAEQGNLLFLSKLDLERTLEPILTPQVFPKPKVPKLIVIDPGHGGKDPGARNEKFNLVEKSLTLDLAKKLQDHLEAAGYKVILTRTKDEFIPLSDRSAFANQRNADLFISIHFNAIDKNTIKGVETYAFTPKWQPSTSRSELHSSDKKDYKGNEDDPWNMLLAFYVQKELIAQTRSNDRGLKRARFTVLEGLEMPGILIESGFLSHTDEGANIGSAAYRNKLAAAITEAVQTYNRSVMRLQN